MPTGIELLLVCQLVWATVFTAQMALDCLGVPPTCGCVGGTQGNTMHALFDSAPNDCSISASELQNNGIIMSLLQPDLTINGQPALSFGVGFTTVRGDFPFNP